MYNFQLKEEQSVYGSDEEVDDHLELDSDEDLSDDAKEHMHEEVPKQSFISLSFVLLIFGSY